MKRFRGRVIVPGTVKAAALVSRGEVNISTAFRKALQSGDKEVPCTDRSNPDLLGKSLGGKALCLPRTTDSDSGGMTLYCVCAKGQQPACLLFSEPIDPSAAAGAVMACAWLENVKMPVIDSLGEAFLRYVEDGMTVTLEGDGILRVE